jgi:hypothetical protein
MTLYGALYVLALARPRFFYDFFVTKFEPKTKLFAALYITLLVLKWFSVTKFFYHASYGIFHIIPAHWMRYDEDGEVEGSTREYCQFVFAILAGAFALDGGEKAGKEGERLRSEELEKHARWLASLEKKPSE